MSVPFLPRPAIERRAAEVQAAALEAGASSGAPVDVDYIVEFALDYGLHQGASLPSGVLGYTAARGKVVYISDDIPHEGRRRFTVAHEIGHITLHLPFLMAQDQQPALFSQPAGPVQDKSMEWQADFFAGALLMPRELLVEHFGRAARAGEPIDPARVADVFNVSREAARIRLEELQMLLRVPPGGTPIL